MDLSQIPDADLLRYFENSIRVDMRERARSGGPSGPLASIKAFRDELLRRLERAEKTGPPARSN